LGDEVGEVGIVERICFAEITAGIELVVPDLAGTRPLLEEQADGLDTCALESAAWTIKDGVKVAFFEELLAKAC
jgi:hypothetical protein